MTDTTIASAGDFIPWVSPAMRDLEADIACASGSDANVMITGATGVGKQSVAYRIHRQSRRAPGPFVVAHSDELDPAHTLDLAMVQATRDGTVLVEDAERMSLSTQSWLLRFTDRATTQEFLGPQSAPGDDDVRFITAANRDVFELVRFRRFCEPLFYRLNAIHLIIPPLRDRPEDIPVLLRHFLSLYASAAVPRLSTAAWEKLLTYPWPGNVRELRAVAETLASREPARLVEPDDLPPAIGQYF